MKRHKHSLSHYKLASMDMGELVPVGCYEVLPGDSVQHASSALVRASPLLAPVMHPVSVRLHSWFVPFRLLWDDWEPFITGGTDGEGDGAVYPTIASINVAAGSLANYLGLPPLNIPYAVSALPFRAYAMIFNEFYRDQDLTTALTIDTTSGTDNTTNTTLQSCAWEKDYISAARPWPQKGPDVTLPLGTTAPVTPDGIFTLADATTGLNPSSVVRAAGAGTGYTSGSAGTAGNTQYSSGLEVDLTGATAVDVNTVRRAFALQRWQEARALYGSRYTEYLRYLGIRSSDARLQRPEYLGGGKQTISFTEVLQTAPTTSGNELGVADLKGHGIAAMRSGRFRRFFEEHGYVMTLMSVRPRVMYASGVHRMWSRTTMEDHWQKELEDIGQQEILNKEVYGIDSGPTDVFGYGDRYSEYRSVPSQVAADFYSTLNDWHFARVFTAAELKTLMTALMMQEKSVLRLAAKDGQPESVAVEYRKVAKEIGSLMKKINDLI